MFPHQIKVKRKQNTSIILTTCLPSQPDSGTFIKVIHSFHNGFKRDLHE